MAVTRSNSISPAFTQPALGGTVVLRLDPGIDWLRVGAWLKIENVGVYQLLSKSGFNFTLELKRAIVPEGTAATKSVIHPVAAAFSELVDSPVAGFENMKKKIVYVGEDEERLEYGEEGEIGEFPNYRQQFNNALNF